MSGICGWTLAESSQGRMRLSDMATANRLHRDKGADGVEAHIGDRSSAIGQYAAADTAAGLAAAVSGRVRFLDSNIARIAAERGNAVALIALYRQAGDRFLERLRGPFTIALFDTREDSTWLAADRMGIEPLSFALTADGSLVFGSTADAVLASGQVEARYSSQALLSYIYFHVIPSPATVYEGVAKLEPAQYLRYRGGNIETGFHWQPEFVRRGATPPQDAEAQLFERLETAVRRGQPDGDAGGFLSGGIDSSTVCGMASQQVGHAFPAFTMGFDQQGYDEVEFANVSAKHFGLDLSVYYVTVEDVADTMSVIAETYDEPFGNSSAIPAYLCATRAREAGLSRLLAGDGGDELFAGNERYSRQLLFDHYRRVPAPLRSGVLEPLLGLVPDSWEHSPLHKARRYVEQARVPMPERLQTYNLLHMLDLESIFDAEFLTRVDPAGPISDTAATWSRSDGDDVVDRMLALDWKLTLADNDIRKVSRMCGAAGIEVEYPMMDDDLVELSTRIPPDVKLSGGKLRHFFKHSMRDYLPRDVLEKEKHGFGLPFGEWLNSSARLKTAVDESMDHLRDTRLLKDEFVTRLMDDHRNNHAAFFGGTIWVLTTLSMWMRAHPER